LSDCTTKHCSTLAVCSKIEHSSYSEVIYCCWRYCLTSYRYCYQCYHFPWCYLSRYSSWCHLSLTRSEAQTAEVKDCFRCRLYRCHHCPTKRILSCNPIPNTNLLFLLDCPICRCYQTWAIGRCLVWCLTSNAIWKSNLPIPKFCTVKARKRCACNHSFQTALSNPGFCIRFASPVDLEAFRRCKGWGWLPLKGKECSTYGRIF